MTLVETHGIYLGSFVYSVLSGFIPFMNAELFLLYVGATATPSQLPGVALLATLGQMVAKSALYCGGRGLIPLPRRFGNKALDAVLERLSLRTEAATGVTFVSAVTGLPPFYAISVLAGVLRWPFALFLVAGSFGRVIRFSAVLYLPGLLERNVSMNLEIAALIGLLAGAHTSTWGMYKDCPYEGFTLQKYLRSTFISTTLAICWQWTAGLDLTTASGRLVLFGLTYVTERGLVELYKGFFREEDQSKYFIPMQFHVMGRVIHSRATRWTVAAVWVAVVLFMAWALRAWQQAGPGVSPFVVLLVIGSIGGWLSAFGGAFKDAPIEGFETFKFFRSPALALLWSSFIATLHSDFLYITLCGLGFTVATIETYKTFFFPNIPRGKFAGKPIQHPHLLVWRYRFAPLFAAIWVVLLGHIALALQEPSRGLIPGQVSRAVAP